MVVELLLIVTVTAEELAVLPVASRATAVSACEPLTTDSVLKVTLYGALVSSGPRFAPSSLNCTPDTPTLSAALADTVNEPDTVAPLAGAVRETVGAVVSGVVESLSAMVRVALAGEPTV